MKYLLVIILLAAFAAGCIRKEKQDFNPEQFTSSLPHKIPSSLAQNISGAIKNIQSINDSLNIISGIIPPKPDENSQEFSKQMGLKLDELKSRLIIYRSEIKSLVLINRSYIKQITGMQKLISLTEKNLSELENKLRLLGQQQDKQVTEIAKAL